MSYTFFWKNRSPFSNWYPSKFKMDFEDFGEIEFLCGEQYMMWQKAMLFKDYEVAAKILETADPKTQKDYGREIKGYVDKEWAAVRLGVVAEGLYYKFSQNEKCKIALLATGDSTIAEASPVDPLWGIGLAEDHPDARNESRWRGQNLLGKALMIVRDRIAK